MADLEHLIDTTLLQLFGKKAVAPLGRAIVNLSETVGAIDERLEAVEEGGGGTSAGTESRLDGAEQNILALTLALAIEQNASVDGTADNIAVEVFSDNSGFILISGIYDSENHRIYA